MRKRGERVLGPYEQHNGFRIVEIDDKGKRDSSIFPTQKAAELYKEFLLSELARDDHTTKSALDVYRKHLEAKGNKADSVRQTCWVIGLFFPDPINLALLTPKRCQVLYDEMRERPTARTKKPPSVDTHRGGLAQVRSFISWCIDRGFMKGANPFADVKGIGKRRPRGKSLGKAGNELRVKETRAWYTKAVELASNDDEGATAALVALLLGMRASEIVSRRVSDLDDDQEAADLLWIPCSKTPAGRRTLEVPDVLHAARVRRRQGARSLPVRVRARARSDRQAAPPRLDPRSGSPRV